MNNVYLRNQLPASIFCKILFIFGMDIEFEQSLSLNKLIS